MLLIADVDHEGRPVRPRGAMNLVLVQEGMKFNSFIFHDFI